MVALADYEILEEIIDPIEELRDQWFAARHGKITCSRFGDLIGKGRAKDAIFTETGMSYLKTVAAERIGSFSFGFSAPATNWGTENEEHALCAYAAKYSVTVDQQLYRFHALTEDIGGTPDALIGEDGCVEVKCPYSPAEHFATLISREVPSKYVWQVHGHLLVTGRQWCDFVSFDPRIDDSRRLVVIRVPRDEEKIAFLRSRLDKAVEVVNELVKASEAYRDGCQV